MRGWLLLGMLLSACGEDSSGGPYTPIEDFANAYHTAECTHLVACHEVADQATCLATNIYDLSVYVDPQTIAYVESAKIRYNGSAVAACLATYAARSCNPHDLANRVALSECLVNVYTGTILGGQPCTASAECISQSCANGQCGQNQACCVGMCVGSTAPMPMMRVPIGGTCTVGEGFDACDVGGYCDTSSSVCKPVKQLGAMCNGSNECGDGLDCNQFPVGGGPAVCVRHPGLGESCSADPTCSDEGTYCDSTTRICKQVGLIGASCTSAQCSSLYQCDPTTRVCAAYPTTGSPCDQVGRCNDYNSYCDTSRVCALPAAKGATCQGNVDCESQYCDVATQKCAAFPVCM